MRPARCAPWVRMSFGLLAAMAISSGRGATWAQDGAGKALDEIGPRAVFKPSPQDVETQLFRKMQACEAASAWPRDAKFISCIVSALRQAGASPEATAGAVLLEGEGYLVDFRKMGKVDLASAVYPLRANDNEGYVLVNGRPRVVQVEDFANWKRIDITKDPIYPALARKFPKLELWGTGAEFKAMQPLPGGGQRFVFSFVLLNGCHACEVGGYARIAFDFNPAGELLGTKLLGLRTTR